MAEEAAIALVDTHTHLNDEKFAGDVEETIARARAAGVTRLINMGDTMASSERAVALAAAHAGLYAGVGIHPEEAGRTCRRSLPSARSASTTTG